MSCEVYDGTEGVNRENARRDQLFIDILRRLEQLARVVRYAFGLELSGWCLGLVVRDSAYPRRGGTSYIIHNREEPPIPSIVINTSNTYMITRFSKQL